jgi:cyclohexyl-isocyanide hydratase
VLPVHAGVLAKRGANLALSPATSASHVDRNRLTGGGIFSGCRLRYRSGGTLGRRGYGASHQLIMEYAPQPPYGSDRP